MAITATGAGQRRPLDIWAWREEVHFVSPYQLPWLTNHPLPLGELLARFQFTEQLGIRAVGPKGVAIGVYAAPEERGLPMRYVVHLAFPRHDELIFAPAFPALLDLLRHVQPLAEHIGAAHDRPSSSLSSQTTAPLPTARTTAPAPR